MQSLGNKNFNNLYSQITCWAATHLSLTRKQMFSLLPSSFTFWERTEMWESWYESGMKFLEAGEPALHPNSSVTPLTLGMNHKALQPSALNCGNEEDDVGCTSSPSSSSWFWNFCSNWSCNQLLPRTQPHAPFNPRGHLEVGLHCLQPRPSLCPTAHFLLYLNWFSSLCSLLLHSLCGQSSQSRSCSAVNEFA